MVVAGAVYRSSDENSDSGCCWLGCCGCRYSEYTGPFKAGWLAGKTNRYGNPVAAADD